MGFPQLVCETALSRTQNNLKLDTELLLTLSILVQRAREEELARNKMNWSASGPSTEAADSTLVELSGSASTNKTIILSNQTSESTSDELMGTKNNAYSEALVDEASIPGPRSEIMGDGESSGHVEGDDAKMTLKATFKHFENKLCISSDNKPFDGILSLMNKVQQLVQDELAHRTAILKSTPSELSVTNFPAIVGAKYSDSNHLLTNYNSTSAVVLTAPALTASKTDRMTSSNLAQTIQNAIALEEKVNAHYRRLCALLDLTTASIAQSLSANPSDATIRIEKYQLSLHLKDAKLCPLSAYAAYQRCNKKR
ncbi:hypothetical protein BY996DRAFT_8689994 [Phakopsora pachyrhizi]|nr:hypothetical protein BY996DRAFT_8689994 [Phakopsora pachyrhizi]